MWSELKRTYIVTEKWFPKKVQGKSPPQAKTVTYKVVNGHSDQSPDLCYEISNPFCTLENIRRADLKDVTIYIYELMVLDQEAVNKAKPLMPRPSISSQQRYVTDRASLSVEEAEALPRSYRVIIYDNGDVYSDYDGPSVQYVYPEMHSGVMSLEELDKLPKTFEDAEALAIQELRRLLDEWDIGGKEQYESSLEDHKSIRQMLDEHKAGEQL
jgi:hypothetical protein